MSLIDRTYDEAELEVDGVNGVGVVYGYSVAGTPQDKRMLEKPWSLNRARPYSDSSMREIYVRVQSEQSPGGSELLKSRGLQKPALRE